MQVSMGVALPLCPVCPEQVAPARHMLLDPSRATLQPEDSELGSGGFVCCLRVRQEASGLRHGQAMEDPEGPVQEE